MNPLQSILSVFLLQSTVYGIGGLQFLMEEDKSSLKSHDNHNHVPLSYMDLLYGDLVNGEREIAHVSSLREKGELKPPLIDYNEIPDSENLNEFSIDSIYKQTLIADKHTFGASKLKLPEKDFTKDLWTTREAFNGLNTFGNTIPKYCLNSDNIGDKDFEFDVAIVGAGFDTATSYRPGARFGPRGIRISSKRLGGTGILPTRGYLNRYIDDHYEFKDKIDPYNRDPFMSRLHAFSDISVVDCGDIPMSAFDNRVALDALYRGHRLVHKYGVPEANYTAESKDSKYLKIPRIITLGGDHTITLMTLKSASEVYDEPVTVLHFDSHMDSWIADLEGGAVSDYARLTHGSYLHYAAEKGYMNRNNSMHIGIRGKARQEYLDMENDVYCGFKTIFAREIDVSGVKGIVDQVKEHVYGTTDIHNSVNKNTPVYITFDIDTLDPSDAPATGTLESGGFTIREVLNILDGFEGMNLVGADLVEVAPIYDNPGETTALNAAQIVDSFLGLMTAYKVKHTKNKLMDELMS